MHCKKVDLFLSLYCCTITHVLLVSMSTKRSILAYCCRVFVLGEDRDLADNIRRAFNEALAHAACSQFTIGSFADV